jgi:hypothetical protein
MSKSQRVMLFKLFHRAAAVMRRAADDDLRHELTEAALGRAKSWTKLNNGDVDRLKAHLQVIIEPDNFDARMAVNDPDAAERRRLIIGVERYLPNHPGACFFEEYVEAISLNKFDTRNWRTLPVERMRELHLTISARASTKKQGGLTGFAPTF